MTTGDSLGAKKSSSKPKKHVSDGAKALAVWSNGGCIRTAASAGSSRDRKRPPVKRRNLGKVVTPT